MEMKLLNFPAPAAGAHAPGGRIRPGGATLLGCTVEAVFIMNDTGEKT
jgi:hypothetical protein